VVTGYSFAVETKRSSNEKGCEKFAAFFVGA